MKNFHLLCCSHRSPNQFLFFLFLSPPHRNHLNFFEKNKFSLTLTLVLEVPHIHWKNPRFSFDDSPKYLRLLIIANCLPCFLKPLQTKSLVFDWLETLENFQIVPSSVDLFLIFLELLYKYLSIPHQGQWDQRLQVCLFFYHLKKFYQIFMVPIS